ncbi:protein ORF11 [Cyprinid herpesvirus 3]|nr:protein ORF11 [Cyprinid herpesvirus 3]
MNFLKNLKNAVTDAVADVVAEVKINPQQQYPGYGQYPGQAPYGQYPVGYPGPQPGYPGYPPQGYPQQPAPAATKPKKQTVDLKKRMADLSNTKMRQGKGVDGFALDRGTEGFSDSDDDDE